ncbi:ribonuclease III [Gloeophyllum trabeum ATCC 11539]|uniref:Ribonuclease III n=1 Tax=Gloeophyllum trabeum (strain ATCC 11539 / FP-39264 / Madison 617) TaxID=670483 RepID=S7RZT4_GLOTA|nr:ribonuclease III [Gloeophyllum trabeum ATCC 11539]EPQ58949.1 ribonuclease III [Gloeophyllum trabeum ATCC 11539]
MLTTRPHSGDQTLPPLALLRSKDIEKQVFTHRSLHGRPGHLFEDPPDDPAPDNEKLEHQGDSVLLLVVTDLLREEYPYLRVGPSTKIRSLVVNNSTLAAISRQYRLSERLRQHVSQSVALRASTNVQADLFEAYVGGLYIDQGLDAVKAWLYPLFRPYIHEAYRIVKEQHTATGRFTEPEPEPEPEQQAAEQEPENSEDHDGDTPPVNTPRDASSTTPTPELGIASPTVGHLSLFNQHVSRQGKVVEWVYDASGSRATPIWTAKALVNGDCLGSGRGRTKQLAKDAAAREGLAKIGVHVPYVFPGM